MAIKNTTTTTVWKCDICESEFESHGNNPLVMMTLKGKPSQGKLDGLAFIDICKQCLLDTGHAPLVAYANTQ